MLRRLAALLMLATVLLVGGCGEDGTKADAPEPKSNVDGTRTQVIRMPDGFRNVVFSCFGTVGIYVTSRGIYEAGSTNITALPSSVAVLPNDPHCK